MTGLDAGQLDHPVTLWRETTAQDAGGNITQTWAKLTGGDVWANIRPLVGRETLLAGAMKEVMTHQITIRHFPGLVTKDRMGSHDLVTNGTFAADSDWTKGTGWTISGGTATHAAGSESALTQVLGTTAGAVTTYTLRYTVSGRTAGTIQPTFDGAAGTSRSTNASFEEEVSGTGAMTLLFTASSTFDGSLDDISVYETRVYHIFSIGVIGRDIGMELGCKEVA